VANRLVNSLESHLDELFAEFAAMQADQLDAVAKGRLEDLAVWQEKRERVFGRLQFYLERLQAEPAEQSGPGLRPELASKIKALLEGETSLMCAAVMQRQELQGKLTAMRKGKKALVGYGPGQGAGRSARFLSSKT